MKNKLAVLIVEDSAIYRRLIGSAVDQTGIATAVKSASNGTLALELIKKERFDAVLMDVNMPEMDGIETLTHLRKMKSELPVIMISSSGGKNAEVTLRALHLGAMDFIIKPLEQDYETNMMLLTEQLKTLFEQIGSHSTTLNPKSKVASSLVGLSVEIPRTKLSGIDLVVIASSTGGPVAVERVLSELGEDFSKPVLLVQHMPPDFTRTFSESLDKKCFLSVREAYDGQSIRAGQVLVAPGGYHMIVEKAAMSGKQVRINLEEHVNGVRPAADVLFKSVAKVYEGARILAIILTGMGTDGREGIRNLKKSCTCYCIVQNEETCVVYGMPKSVVEAGLSDEVLGITEIAARIRHIAQRGS